MITSRTMYATLGLCYSVGIQVIGCKNVTINCGDSIDIACANDDSVAGDEINVYEGTDGGDAAAPEEVDSCDDGNPCTQSANCTPCSILPTDEQTTASCTPDDELPSFCSGLVGCVHVAVTTPQGQINDCFPVVAYDSDAGLQSGVCMAGVCMANPSSP